MNLLFVWKGYLSSLSACKKVSMVNSKPTIDYNYILIKPQFIKIIAVGIDNISPGEYIIYAVSDNETHSERFACTWKVLYCICTL